MFRARPESQAKLFASVGICLLPLGIVFFHSDWPPIDWKHTHWATANIGRDDILPVSVLFLLFALVYFVFPRIFQRRMNRTLSRLHFWANMAFLLFEAAGPIVQGLTWHFLPNESSWGRFSRGFSASIDFFMWEILIFLAAQLFLVVNLVWSVFKGESVLKPVHLDA